ncbi:carbohydrate ABC transporter permease [Cohnella sp. GCM10027633]|uniref:carbohydrate ABC transporter permease n=1 Tax=unclassified Cohnella TaxID=2636738 RepID=UPI00363E496F
MTSLSTDAPPSVVHPPGKRKYRHPNDVKPAAHFAINAVFIGYGLLCLLPILLVLAVSFSDERSVALHGYSLFPEKLSWDAYAYLWSDRGQIVRSYGISIVATIAGSAVGLLMTALFAYPLARGDFSFRTFFSFYIFFTMIFNGGLVPWYLVYTNYIDVKDTLLALIVPGLLLNGFSVIMVRTFFQTTIHPSLIESASIDGAGEMRIFFRIVLPLSMPVMATIGLFYTLGYWNNWFNSMVFINDEKLINLQYLMYKAMVNIQVLFANAQNGSSSGVTDLASQPNETVRMAMCIVGMGPIVLAYPFFQQYFVKGLTIGAIKG